MELLPTCSLEEAITIATDYLRNNVVARVIVLGPCDINNMFECNQQSYPLLQVPTLYIWNENLPATATPSDFSELLFFRVKKVYSKAIFIPVTRLESLVRFNRKTF